MTTLSRSVLGGDSCPLLSARIQKRRSHSAAPSVRRCRRLGRRLGMVLLLRRGQAGADKVHHPRRKGRRRRGCILPQRRKGGGKNGFLIHRGLLLTTHGTIPSAAAAGAAEVRLSHGRLPARLVPQSFFITSPILDLTIIGLNIVDDDSNSHGQQPHFLKTCLNPSLDLGITVLLLGHTNRRDLAVGEGKVAIATDNLTKFSSDEVSWRPGSAMGI